MDKIILLAALVIGITLHEFAHALMGDYLGDTTARDHGRISLNPLAHIDPFMTLILPLFLILFGLPVFAAAKPVPFNPWAVRGGKWGAVLVAMAGPFTNLLLAAFLALWLHLIPFNLTAWQWLGGMIVVNVNLFVFNMIPFPPLDGSRLLYAVVPSSVQDLMDRIEQGGMMLLFLVLFFGYRYIAPFIGTIAHAITALLLPAQLLP